MGYIRRDMLGLGIMQENFKGFFSKFLAFCNTQLALAQSEDDRNTSKRRLGSRLLYKDPEDILPHPVLGWGGFGVRIRGEQEGSFQTTWDTVDTHPSLLV